MEYHDIDALGRRLARLALGTVELGVEYGIRRPGEAGRPPRAAAVALIHAALEAGINLFDTAPGYGASEAIVGEALRGRGESLVVATKVEAFRGLPAGERRAAILRSIDESRARLGRDRIELLQMHNAEPADLCDPLLRGALRDALARGWVERLGASVYGVEAARAAVDDPELAAVQVAFNLLDRRMAAEVAPAAAANGTALMIRSAFLKGALTDRRDHLPAHLGALREAAERAARWAEARGRGLAECALRFCLDQRFPGVVLVGVGGRSELEFALRVAAGEGLGEAALGEAEGLAVGEPEVIDPRFWGIP
ncbi:aldo/keto reductase [Endothiovibrio diazotrophicus]